MPAYPSVSPLFKASPPTHKHLLTPLILANEVDIMFSELTSIFKDLTDRVKAGDTSLISGICKFIQTFKKLQHSHSPVPAISYALHNLGKSDRKCYSYLWGGHVRIEYASG